MNSVAEAVAFVSLLVKAGESFILHSVVLGLQCLAEMGRISIFHALGSERQLNKQVCLLPSLNP